MSDDRFDVRIEGHHLPRERIRIRKLTGREAISRLFEFEIDIVCLGDEGVDTRALMGADVTLVFERGGAELRRVRGMIAELEDLLHTEASVRSYRIRVVPRAFRLGMIETQDIFMNLTVPEILARKLKQVGLGKAMELRLRAEYPKREFVVQYGETDLAFVSRLAEHLGVSFYFEHDPHHGRQKMIFTDHHGGFGHAEGAPEIAFRERGDRHDVFELRERQRLIPSLYAVQDYNYRTPHLGLTLSHEVAGAHPGGVVEHGAHFKTPEEGLALARIRAEEREATALVYTGRSALPGLSAGARRTLEGHPAHAGLDLLFVEVEHQASLPVAGSGTDQPTYVNSFVAIPGGRTYRPPRTTPRPKIAGLVHAIVDPGPEGRDKYAQIDDQGRYMVRFLFETAPPGGRPASRPVRMLQNHAGENYGTHFPLRPGAEVMVGFVNGDPDRPVIVGAAPNPAKPSPVTGKEPGLHRIMTGSGIYIDLIDDL